MTGRLVTIPTGSRPLDLVGGTPLLDLSHHAPAGVGLFAKAEWANPGGSVKDRAAARIVQDAIARGEIDPGNADGPRLLDATSGNTGIAYAWIGAALGFGVSLAISEAASPARKAILQAYGAELIWTDAAETTDGAIRKARELAAAEPKRYWYADQYNNPSNVQAHVETTAPEIWDQTHGAVTHLVAGLGTTGTLTGTAKGLRARRPDLHVTGVEPDQAFHGLEGLKHLPTAIRPGIYDEALVDATVRVATEQAYAAARGLAASDGLLVGVSSGAAFHAARDVAASVPTGSVVVTVFPDGGERYLDTPLWSAP